MQTQGWGAGRGEKWRTQIDAMEAMLAPVDGAVVRALQIEQACRIVDVGCGGGATAIEISRRAPVGSVVHGVDISPALVEVARARARQREGAVTFEVADMQRAAPPAELYDRMVSRFGVMFFDDAPAAFENLAQWLTPGGRFAFAVWGHTRDNPWLTTVRDVVARVVELPTADPDAPGPFRYGDADKLLGLLERAGFCDLHASDWRGSLPIGGSLSATEAARFALTSFSSFAELLHTGGEGKLEAAHRALTEEFLMHEEDGAVRMNAWVHVFTGARRIRRSR